MIKGIYTNAAAMNSLQLKQEVTANNIANANTTGFKKEGVFRKYLIDHATILQQNATDFKHLEDVDEVVIDFSQGEFVSSGNPLDTAIEGSGFFAIQSPNGIYYTRNGNFVLNQQGILVAGNGDEVLGTDGPIQLQGGNVFIGDDGSVSVDGNFVDVIQVVDFPKPYRLNKIGEGLFEAAPGTAMQLGTDQFRLRQGVVEQANVEIVEEMVDLIQTSRDFETNQRSITMQDATLDRAVNDVGRVQK